MQESMRIHEQRMDHVDMRLAEITDKLDGLIGFMGGYFKGPQLVPSHFFRVNSSPVQTSFTEQTL